MRLDCGCGLKREGDVNIDVNSRLRPDVVADFRFLPFRDGAFSLVNFTHSLEHVTDPSVALKEAVRILKKRGILKVKFPNYFSIAILIRMLKGKEFWNHGGTHKSILSTPSLLLMFIRHGIMPIKFKADPRYLQKYWIMRMIYTIFPFLCPDVTIIGKK